MTRELVAIGVVALLATGCGARVSVRHLEDEITSLRAEVTDLRRSQDIDVRELARTVEEVQALATRNAELQAALRDQAAEAGRLRARLDAAERDLREAAVPTASQPAVNTPVVPSLAPGPPPAPTVRAVSPRPRAEPEPADAEAAYTAAMANFRAREHGQAVLDFLDFIATFPTHPLAPSAQYWIGEAYYVQRDYQQALVEFQRVLDMAPASLSAADALLRIGQAHTNLRENSRAQQAWQRVVRDYPRSDAAGKARTLLREHAARRP